VISPRASWKQRNRLNKPCVKATTEAVNNTLIANVKNVMPNVAGKSEVLKHPAIIAGIIGHNGSMSSA
jgi:hypothetical protein